MKFREFFYLHKSDRQTILMLLALSTVIIVAVWLLGQQTESVVVMPEVKVDSLSLQEMKADTIRQPYYRQEEKQTERFAFDPNTADSTQLLRLGLQPWQVRNIYKYRAAGGIYRKKEDFARLYGLTVKQYRELEPYIRISSDYLPASTLVETRQINERDTLRYPVKLKEKETIDLGLADTAMLKKVPGIGSYYAHRIVEYGQRLGGYVSIDQLDEIENFPADAKQYIILSAVSPHKMNINQLSLNELKRHPYINYYMAQAIVDYRRQQGPLRDLDDLKLLPDFTTEVIERLRPYVEY